MEDTIEVDPELFYPEGWVGIPITLTNQGRLDSSFSVSFSLEKINKMIKSLAPSQTLTDLKIINSSKGVKVREEKKKGLFALGDSSRPVNIELPAGGFVLFHLLYELSEGDYKIDYEYFRKKGSESFGVRNYNVVSIKDFELSIDLSTITVKFEIENKGVNEFKGSFNLDLELSATETATGSITIPINQSEKKEFKFPIPDEVIPGIYSAKLGIYHDKTKIAEKIKEYRIEPLFVITSVKLNGSETESLHLYPGGDYELSLKIENRGNLEASCKLICSLFNMREEGLINLPVGSSTKISFPLSICEDFTYEDTQLKLILDYERATKEPGVYYLPVKVYGIFLEVSSQLDKDFYKIDDKATLTIQIKNISQYIGSFSVYAEVSLYDYTTKTLFTLVGTETKSLLFSEIPIAGFDQKLFYSLCYRSGKVIYINSLYLYEEDYFMVYSPQDYYQPGTQAVFMVKVSEPGTLSYQVSYLHYGLVEGLSGTQGVSEGENILILDLPEYLRLGSYDLECQFFREGEKTLIKKIKFDVAGFAILTEGLYFDKDYYLAKETMSVTFLFKPKGEIGTATLRAWALAPDSTKTIVGFAKKDLFLRDNVVEVVLPIKLATEYSGIHTLQYCFFKGNRLLSNRICFFDVKDLENPKSHLSIKGDYFEKREIEVELWATDGKGTGIKNIVLFSKREEEATYTPYGTRSTSGTILFKPERDGIYQFISQAEDKAGNLEAFKDQPEATATVLVEDKAIIALDNNEIIVYPNPCKQGKYVYFKNVSQEAIIKIYNIKGELIERIIVDEEPEKWDVRDIASGVYLYLIQDVSSNKRIGKIGVIK
ncbi:MAG: T9SS type A sorting domain-containing protein [bacterium]